MSQNKETCSDYNHKGFQGLINIIEQLRSENGCPWDKKQTEETLKPYILEEAYEVIEALDSQDTGEISEELGDLLLQVVFISQIYAEKKIFSIEDVIEKINNKLLRRHPHVFDKTFSLKEGECLDDIILENWEKIKKLEKNEKKYKKQSYNENNINNKGNNNDDNKDGNNNLNINNIINSSIYVIKNMPALHRAYMIQEKASRQGFDFSSIDEALDKISEETREFREEIENFKNDFIGINNIKDNELKLLNNNIKDNELKLLNNNIKDNELKLLNKLNNNIDDDKNIERKINLNNDNIDKNNINKIMKKEIKKDNYVFNANENHINKIKEEYGDLLFSIVNIGRLLDLHPCDALNKASDKFVKRFHYIENQLASVQNSNIKSADADALNNLWEEAKKYTE
ncbi:MAG: nucleoside triphosphate pyrophosphohydrolase [bacterium]